MELLKWNTFRFHFYFCVCFHFHFYCNFMWGWYNETVTSLVNSHYIPHKGGKPHTSFMWSWYNETVNWHLLFSLLLCFTFTFILTLCGAARMRHMSFLLLLLCLFSLSLYFNFVWSWFNETVTSIVIISHIKEVNKYIPHKGGKVLCGAGKWDSDLTPLLCFHFHFFTWCGDLVFTFTFVLVFTFTFILTLCDSDLIISHIINHIPVLCGAGIMRQWPDTFIGLVSRE